MESLSAKKLAAFGIIFLSLLFSCSILTDFGGQNTPRGVEHNSTTDDSNITYDFPHVKKWPESGTDSAKTAKISPESQEATDSDLAKIVQVWPGLPEHIKAAIKALAGLTKKNEGQ